MADKSANPAKRDPMNRWVPLALIGFFLVVFTADTFLVVTAFNTSSGLWEENAPTRGREYNAQIAVAREQAERGWEVRLAKEMPTMDKAVLTFDMSNQLGDPITGATVTATFRRAVQDVDFQADLPDLGGGRYGRTIDLPLPGQWFVHVLAETPSGETWQETTWLIEDGRRRHQ